MKTIARLLVAVAAMLPLGTAVLTSVGCSQKETILEVETPEGELEVTKDEADGEIEVDVDDK